MEGQMTITELYTLLRGTIAGLEYAHPDKQADLELISSVERMIRQVFDQAKLEAMHHD